MTKEEAASIIEERVRVTEYVESSYVDCVDIEALRIAIKALAQPDCADCKKHGGDWECDYNTCHKGMDTISRQQAIDALLKGLLLGEDSLVESIEECNSMIEWAADVLKNLPSAQPEWNNHTVACLLAELFDDTCACNYNGIDEWLPEKCELLDSCPNPGGVACWEQFLKHKAERRTDE